MPKAPLYRARGRTSRSRDTRSRILQATRELLDEGGFHESTVEEVGDRRGEMARLVRRLDEGKRLGRGTGRREALSYLMVATSFGTYRELRQERLSDAKLTAMLQDMARTLLVDS